MCTGVIFVPKNQSTVFFLSKLKKKNATNGNFLWLVVFFTASKNTALSRKSVTFENDGRRHGHLP